MFSRRIALTICLVVALVINLIVLVVINKGTLESDESGGIAISFVAPFQQFSTYMIRSVKGVWHHYFFLISAAKENEYLRKEVARAAANDKQRIEIDLSNLRLRKLLNFKKSIPHKVLAAEVIGKDPSPWFKTILIDRGDADGLKKGLPVVVPQGIVGQIIEVRSYYSKVLLLIDRNSAVDAIIQRNRARGIVEGESESTCIFKYVLRKHDVNAGDTVISSGLDGVFPKGLRIGVVESVEKRHSGTFQLIEITPFVDFEGFEEVLIIMNPTRQVHSK
jgi:rod shape-determining protein MreC